MDNVPSVTTIGGMPASHTIAPLNAPSANPTPAAASIRMETGTSGKAAFISDTRTPENAMLAPTDRSMHLVRMTVICPKATIMRIAVSLNKPTRLRGATKLGVMKPMPAIIVTTIAASRMSRFTLISHSHRCNVASCGGGKSLGGEAGPVEAIDDATLPHDDHPVRHSHDFRYLGRDHDNRGAVRSQFSHESMDGSLRGNIDAFGRLVEDDDLRLG